jgi:trans-aconitate methyltransferase
MYNWDPKLYSSNSSAQKDWGLLLLAKLNLQGNEKVLDVGCGDGKLSAEIAKNLPEGSVLGIDLSGAMITFARNHYPPEKFPNLVFMQMGANELTFDSDFDIVYSNAAFHWMKDLEHVLKNLWKSLKPGGILLAQSGGRGNAVEIFKIVDLMIENEKWNPYFEGFLFPFGFYGPEEYGEWLKNAGFSVKRLELIPKDLVLEGKKGFSDWLIASILHPYTQRIPQDLKEDFVNELINSYIKTNPPDEKGCIHVRMIRLEIEAYPENTS